MAKTVCKAKIEGIVPERGKPSIEWKDKDGKPQYYCYGFGHEDTGVLLDVCFNCKDNVRYAQDDLDKYRREERVL